jgi:hypothetical protein
MKEDFMDHSLIEPNLTSYEQFFDHDWSKRVFELVKSSPLQHAVDTLMVAWRSTNGVHLLPWLLIQSLRKFADGEYNGSVRFRADYSGTVVKGICEKLEAQIPTLNFDQRTALRRAVTRIEEDAFQTLKTEKSKVRFEVERYWEFITHTSEFPFCILGSQRINYGSLFFAYEDFLANTIRTKEPSYSSKNISVRVAFAKHFGDSLTEYCWTHDEVEVAKLVRHALAHNGGRLTPALERYKARFLDATGTPPPLLQGEVFYIVDDKIQITPCNTKYLFRVLKDRVTRIVEELAQE